MVVRRIRPYFGCGIRLLQENRFLKITVFVLLRGCGKLEFKRTVYGFSLTS